MLRVSVIVPARDAEATLPRTLDALAAQELDDGDRFEVIVVDDGSHDRTAELARAAGPPIRVFEQPPLGPAAARDLGAGEAGARLLAFCDADVYPEPGWLRAGVNALAGADIVQGRVLPDPTVALGPFDRSIWITGQVGLWEAANLFTTRDVFDAAGGFVEWIRPRRSKALAEDVWFGYRALRSGARPAFCAEALAHHAVFTRGWRAYAGERTRLRYFPAMAARMPELRRSFLYRRAFLNRRTAQLDLAIAGAALALVRRSPVTLPLTAPYVRAVRAHARRAEPEGPAWPLVAAADVAADAVGLAALLFGSARYAAPVL
jgi:glycosyltransferase involved in cell wall biosynthesis